MKLKPFFIGLYLVWCTCVNSSEDALAEDKGESSHYQKSQLLTLKIRLTKEKDAYKTAEDLYSKEKYEKAILYLNRAIKLNNSEREYYKKRGDCYVALGRLSEAIPDYRKVVEIRPPEENSSNYNRWSTATFTLRPNN